MIHNKRDEEQITVEINAQILSQVSLGNETYREIKANETEAHLYVVAGCTSQQITIPNASKKITLSSILRH